MESKYLNGMIRIMGWGDKTRISFWGNVHFPSNEDAKIARDTYAKELKNLGVKSKRSVMRNQLHPYFGLGQPDGRSGHVYELEYAGPEVPLERR